MKKIIISAALCIGFIIPAFAQESADPTVSRRGIALLPKAGDIAIGIEANPFLDYIGNMFRFGGKVDPAVLLGGEVNLTNASPVFSGFNQTIYGKYFLQDNAAVRIRLGLNFSKVKHKQTVQDDFRTLNDPTNPMPTTIDVLNVGNKGFDLNVGYEMRRGKGRVQGFFGGEIGFSYHKTNLTYDYGNEITVANQAPTTHDFSNVNASYSNLSAASGFFRNIETLGGAQFGLGLGGFVGVEYFFAPQISLGGELGLAFNYLIKGQDTKKDEGFYSGKIQEYEYRNRNAEDVAFTSGLNTTPSAKIFVMFHF